MKLWNSFKKIVLQDVQSENETKKVSVILRVNSIIMCIYFLCLVLIFAFYDKQWRSVVMCTACFAAYALAFGLTYANHTKRAVIFAHGLTVLWIVMFVREFGWDCGVQHFLFALLVLLLTTSYARISFKILMGAAFCGMRLALYSYTLWHTPILTLTPRVSVLFQVINTTFVFAMIVATMTVFGEDTLSLEKKLVVYNEKLHLLASQDPLTGLMNRRSAREQFQQLESEYKAAVINGISVVMGDIDFFKRVNDTYGHECGDEVLKQLAQCFKDFMQGKGRVYRWGGEEFLFIFENLNGDEAFTQIMSLQRIVRKLEVQYHCQTLQVTMTYGLAEYDAVIGMEGTIAEADKKLYQGKESGRDTIIY